VNGRVKRFALVGLSLLVAGSIIGATVYAQAPGDESRAARGVFGRLALGSGNRIDALADRLDVSTEELQAMLDEGLTLQEIAEQLEVELPGRPDAGDLQRPDAAHVGHLDIIAEVIGMTEDELSAELDAGKTLAEIAEEHGVDTHKVRDVMQAEAEQAMRDRIAQAIENGDITQEHADWILEGLDKGFLMKRGGSGGFAGSPMGRLGGMRSKNAPWPEMGSRFPSLAEVGADAAA